MPEPARFIHVDVARVGDLNFRRTVDVTCAHCRRRAEVRVTVLQEHLAEDALVKSLGGKFRCTQCGRRGAELDVRRALGR